MFMHRLTDRLFAKAKPLPTPKPPTAEDRRAWALQFEAKAERMARAGKTVEAATLWIAAQRQRDAARVMGARPAAEMAVAG